jgi:dTMP kinase
VLHRKGDVAPRAEALLYAADRAHHVATKIRPALAAGAVVLSDRYYDSSIAYQGAARELSVKEVQDISIWAVAGLEPDLTFLLDMSAQQAIARRADTGTAPDRLESEQVEFFTRARDQFLKLATQPRFEVIDAAITIPEIHAAVIARIENAGLGR